MPQTVNGIGTHYYGKANLRERRGSCEYCGRAGVIQSYDTRYWFVILFIPIIPLGKKRVIDQCGICTRHRAMKLADWEQARTKAMEEGMRKVVDQPGDLEALVGLHRTCLFFGEWDKADQLGARIEQEFAQDPKAHLHLAGAHAYLGRAGEVEKSLKRARELDPSLVKEADPLASSPALKPAGKKTQRILLGILAVLVLVTVLVVDHFHHQHRTLHVVNGYGVPLTVRIEGLPEFSVSPESKKSIELPEGSHRAHVIGALGADIPFEISSHLLVRLFDSRVFVLNPGGAALLVREQTLYGTASRPGTGDTSSYWFHYGKPFEVFNDIDYAFQPFPHQIKVEHGSSLRRQRLDMIDDPIPDLFRGLLSSHRAPEALALGEWAIDVHSSKTEVLSAYADAAAVPAHRERVLSALKSRLGRRPVEIPLHRTYQNLSLENPQHTLATEYEAYLAADPGNSALLYLRGRLLAGIAACLDSFERAVRADSSNAFAQAAIAHCRASQGNWSDALPPAVRACELDPSNAGFRGLLHDVRMALGQFDQLEKELRDRCVRSKFVPSPELVGLINLLAFRKDREGALKLCDTAVHLRSEMDAKTREAFAAELRCRAFYAAGDLAGLALEVDKGEKAKTASHRLAVLLEQGHLDEADALADGQEPNALATLDRSVAWFLKGNATKAEELRKKAAELLKKSGNREYETAAALLGSGKPLDTKAAANLDIPPAPKAILLTALAQADPESVSELVPRAKALNIGLFFPRYLLGRALAALEPKR